MRFRVYFDPHALFEFLQDLAPSRLPAGRLKATFGDLCEHRPSSVAPAAAISRLELLGAERSLIAGTFRNAVGRGSSRASVDLLAVAFQGALFNVTRTFVLETTRNGMAVLTELVDFFCQGIGRTMTHWRSGLA